MQTLDQIPAQWDPTHLLLLGDTKMGKSTYVAQAALDGHTILYVDSDNGISALRRLLGNNVEAMRRVIYIPTKNPCGFLDGLLTESVFRWNIGEDKKFSSGTARKESLMLEMRPVRMPKSLILCADSWTSVALDAMEAGADSNKVSLEEMGNSQMAVYGDANIKLTLLLAVIQHVKFNVIILGHGTFYERMEKPLGKQNYKMKDMILKETIKIPLSSSRPHGFTMGKYFTDIGWLELDRADRRILDYTPQFGRIGGGTINRKGGVEELSFNRTFGRGVKPDPIELDSSWIKFQSTEEWIAENKTSTTPTPTKPAGTSSGVLPSKPASTGIAELMKKKA